MDYRFGFNGMEAEGTVYGEGNTYDFGARMYDGRIGRWFSVDPLEKKYPHFSPYGFVAESPIMNREIDGEDYIISIDHDSKTITIISNVYVAKNSEDAMNRASDAAKFWNEQSRAYNYVVGKGKNKVIYNVDFKISVTESDNPTANLPNTVHTVHGQTGETSTKEMGEIGSNVFRIVPTEEFQYLKKKHNNDPRAGGVTYDGNHIVVPQAILMGFGTKESVDIHELGHTLGCNHFNGTAMHFATAGGRTVTSIPMIQAILGNAGVTINFFPDSNLPVRTKTIEVGNKPENFENGTVRKNLK